MCHYDLSELHVHKTRQQREENCRSHSSPFTFHQMRQETLKDLSAKTKIFDQSGKTSSSKSKC